MAKGWRCQRRGDGVAGRQRIVVPNDQERDTEEWPSVRTTKVPNGRDRILSHAIACLRKRKRRSTPAPFPSCPRRLDYGSITEPIRRLKYTESPGHRGNLDLDSDLDSEHHHRDHRGAYTAASRSDDGRPGTSTGVLSAPEPYYSNQDIAVLHAVVTSAQEQLDQAPYPKPLPAATLFKAYDHVLPKHGIDPDADQHLSAFVFRVGGERGNGSLVDKFQAILSRMGILLEFGDNNTTVSLRASPSPSLSVIESPANRIRRPPRRQVSRHGSLDKSNHSFSQPPTQPSESVEAWPHSAEHSPRAYDVDQALLVAWRAAAASAPGRWRAATAQPLPQGYNPPAHHQDDLESAFQARQGSFLQRSAPQIGPQQGQSPKPDAQRSALFSVMDRWRNAAVSNQQNHHGDPHSDRGSGEQNASEEVHDLHFQSPLAADVPKSPKEDDGRLRNPQITAIDAKQGEPSVDSRPNQNRPQAPPKGAEFEESHGTPKKEQRARGHLTGSDSAAEKAEYERLLHRAARAREIYLASRVFNHWADRTARRLEREAVARRHMIRFRCFRGWSQAPNSRSPAVDQLRVNTAVQKLQRAVVSQEEQLKMAASAIAQELRLKTIHRILDRWLCHRTRHMARQRAVTRTKTKILARWGLIVASDTARGDFLRVDTRRRDGAHALRKWDDQAQRATTRSVAALQIGTSHLAVAYLRGWWDQAELRRRARAYRAYILMGKTTMAVDQWGLRARAQAFTWRLDYLSATRIFDQWLQKAQYGAQKTEEARRTIAGRSRARALGHMARSNLEESTLSHLQGRARLFIGATRLLDVFDATVKQRQEREWDIVRRQLMVRYQQVSAARKKRSCFAALDRWRSLRAQGADQAQAGQRWRATHDIRQQTLALSRWGASSDKAQKRQSLARSHHMRAYLSWWRSSSNRHHEMDMEVWGGWAARNQRQCLKEWSIASLQQGGHAHTAGKLRQRRERDRRKRALEQWSHDSIGPRNAGGGLESTFELQPKPTANFRSSWGPLSNRRRPPRSVSDIQEYPASPTRTPTRSTGVRLPMASTLRGRPMPPLGEADEEDAADPDARGDVDAAASLFGATPGTLSSTGLPSTTPQAPVPIYLQQQLPSVYTQTPRSHQNPNTRSVRIRRAAANTDLVQAPASTSAAYINSYPSEGDTRLGASQLPAQAGSSKPRAAYSGSRQSTRPELFDTGAKSRSIGAPPYSSKLRPLDRLSASSAGASAVNNQTPRQPSAAASGPPERTSQRRPPN